MFAGAAMSALMGLFAPDCSDLALRGIFAALMAWFLGLALMGIATKWVALTRGALGTAGGKLFGETTSNLPYYYLILWS
jgi:branched-chain amino acid transport system permease protein